MRSRTLILTTLAGLAALPAVAADWPMFRGPQNNGRSQESKAPTHWGPQKNIRWQAELPGDGNGSPIVSNGRVFVTTAANQGKQRTLHGFDRETGKQLWQMTVEYPKAEPTHKTNPYAGSTPAADGKRVVVWHGSAGLHCYDFQGNRLWSRDLGEFRHIWGYGSSPRLYRDRVFVNCGPGERTFLAAVDLESGRILWQTDEPGGRSGEEGRGSYVGSWSTPIVVQVEGRDQILCTMPTRVAAYDPEDGRVLWYVEGLANLPRGNLVYTSPTVDGGYGVAMGGFNGPSLGFRLGGQGNMTEENRLWHQTQRNPQRIGSGVILDGHLYIANAGPGTAECIDVKTGKQRWQARLPGGNVWGSVVSAGGLLYATNQRGTTHVFRPNPDKFELVASNDLGSATNATPAISDGEIFLRTEDRLFCVRDE